MLDAMREIKVGEGVHPTLSIGVGKDVDSLRDLYKNANLSVEMALSRAATRPWSATAWTLSSTAAGPRPRKSAPR